MSRRLIAGASPALLAVFSVACIIVPTSTALPQGIQQVTESAFQPSEGADLFGTVVPTDPPPATVTPFPSSTPPPTPLPEPEEGWELRTPGIERREIIVREPRSASLVRLHIVRIDPSLMDMRVHYIAGGGNTISGWQSQTDALFVVNGGFFTGGLFTEGLTFIENEEHGSQTGYEDRIGVGGLFAIDGGQPQIVPLPRVPEPPGTYNFEYATQTYPILLMPGGVPAYSEETGYSAERTIVALDEEGRVYFIVIRQVIFTLYGLSNMLAELTELDLSIALNLDGGKSSGMEVYAGPEHTHWNAVSVLPIVIAATAREGVYVEARTFRPPVLK